MAGLGKRQMERFTLNVPAAIALKDQMGSSQKASAELRTRNICAGGAFLLTDDPLNLGTQVDVNLHLSFFAGSKEHERWSDIHVSGSVIRIEPDGMAIQFDDKYQILPVQKNN